jgi:hypothetical protein
MLEIFGGLFIMDAPATRFLQRHAVVVEETCEPGLEVRDFVRVEREVLHGSDAGTAERIVGVGTIAPHPSERVGRKVGGGILLPQSPEGATIPLRYTVQQDLFLSDVGLRSAWKRGIVRGNL